MSWIVNAVEIPILNLVKIPHICRKVLSCIVSYITYNVFYIIYVYPEYLVISAYDVQYVQCSELMMLFQVKCKLSVYWSHWQGLSDHGGDFRPMSSRGHVP